MNIFYKVPLLLKEAKLDKLICERLNLRDFGYEYMIENAILTKWKYLAQK